MALQTGSRKDPADFYKAGVDRMASERRETKQKRRQRIIAAIIAIILVLAMIVSAVLAGT